MLASSASCSVTNHCSALWVMGSVSRIARPTSALICRVTSVSPSSACRIASSAVPHRLRPSGIAGISTLPPALTTYRTYFFNSAARFVKCSVRFISSAFAVPVFI